MKQLLLFVVLLTYAVGCGPSAEEKAAQLAEEARQARESAERQAKADIQARYDQGVDAILADKFESFKAVTDSQTQADGPKIGLTWGGIRVMVGLGGLKKADFRIDDIQLNADLTQATVNTSHRVNGEWKKDEKPQIWIVENGAWHWKL